MKSNLKYIITGTILVFAGFLLGFAIMEKSDADKDYRNLFYRSYRIITPEVPDKMDFAGEKVPLDMYYVKESFERELIANTYMQSSTVMMFKRAYRWFPLIEPILKKNNIPDDFKFLALAESNLVNVVSPSGAEGFWQFMKPTGKKYGLEITEEVDERYNVEKATEAACLYFQEAYERYKNWTLVAASFNRGLDGVSTALEKQKAANYYDLFLVDETARYVYRILAFKQIYNHPVKYGFYLREKDFYPQIPTHTVSVDSAIKDLPQFALKMNINYRVLRDLNPWLKRYNLPRSNLNQVYLIKIPNEGYLRYDLLMQSIHENGRFFHDTLRIDKLN
jgi:membrane-bound lytic murein transglycosylase D